jgi:enamine deaminase RidA (YjgF/YER057c/UK114 family)
MFTPINPTSLGAPKGYNNGMLAPAGGRILFVAGQVGWNAQQVFAEGFLAQFDQALQNCLAVVREAGGSPESVGRMTLYVVDKTEYAGDLRQVGQIYRKHMGRHYPAMALVEVKSLLEPLARIEIEVTAVIEHASI